MADWTRSEPIYNLIPNLYVQQVFKDGVFQYYVIYPCNGYVLHVPSGDYTEYDENGNVTLYEPYYTSGGGTCSVNYDFATNPRGFVAVLKSTISPETLQTL